MEDAEFKARPESAQFLNTQISGLFLLSYFDRWEQGVN